MSENVFAIGDIHGCLDLLDNLLEKWNPDKERLVFLGDYVDRGPASLGVLNRVMDLQERYGAVALGGNHENLLLNFLKFPESEGAYYVSPGAGGETIRSFVPASLFYATYRRIAEYIKEEHADVFNFLDNLPDYYESGQHVFVHAGVNLDYEDWRNSNEKDFRWIRSQFHHGVNKTGSIFVFGHTRTRLLNKDKADSIWLSPCGTKIGIDGGAVYGGKLHGLRVTENRAYESFSVQAKEKVATWV